LTSDSTRGWWYDIISEDFDKDGDMDLVLLGISEITINTKLPDNETFDIFYNDFDQNNTGDIVLKLLIMRENNILLRGRQCSSDQIPAIKNKVSRL
jgi:hypothetical protein